MIQSRQNTLVKHLRALSDKKTRKTSGTYLIEGEVAVKEAFLSGAGIVAVLGTPALVAPYENKGFRVESADKDIVDYCADTLTPQGIVAEVKIPTPSGILGDNVVLLDGVSDPGNAGTIIRTCAAVGIKDVIMVNAVDAYSPKCVRSTMSGIFSVNVYDVTAEKALEMVKGKKTVVADMAGETVFDVEVDNFCLVVGSEAHGVSDSFRRAADKTVSLPMKPCMESLNAGVSCSVILYQLLKNKI